MVSMWRSRFYDTFHPQSLIHEFFEGKIVALNVFFEILMLYYLHKLAKIESNEESYLRPWHLSGKSRALGTLSHINFFWIGG